MDGGRRRRVREGFWLDDRREKKKGEGRFRARWPDGGRRRRVGEGFWLGGRREKKKGRGRFPVRWRGSRSKAGVRWRLVGDAMEGVVQRGREKVERIEKEGNEK